MVTQNYDTPDVSSDHSDVVVVKQHNSNKGTSEGKSSMPERVLKNLIDSMETLQLGTYQREHVSNVSTTTATPSNVGRQLFDTGLRLMMAYQHQMAALYFHACLEVNPQAALAHGLIALCHGPNYNFKGDLYHYMSNHKEDVDKPDLQCAFPSQQVADRHSAAALAIIDELQRNDRQPQSQDVHRENNQHSSNVDVNEHTIDKANAIGQDDKVTTDDRNNIQHVATSEPIADIEVQLLMAIRLLTGSPGVDPKLGDELVGRPFANAMRSLYQKYPDDPDVAYLFAEALMVLNAWQLYEYPSGTVLSPDVDEIRAVLEQALQHHKHHPGLLHLYVHLSEMSSQPELALTMCEPLRTMLPHAGHLIHMQTHIDVLVGRYDACVRSNLDAIQADMYTMQISPTTAGRESLYFGYIVVRHLHVS